MSFENPGEEKKDLIEKISFQVLRGPRRWKIRDLLERGDSEALAEVAQELGESQESIALMSQFVRQRKEVLAENDRKIKERFASNIKPTQEEMDFGLYREQLEPQVREAVFVLRKKGYETWSSGFGSFLDQYIGLADIEKIPKDFAFSEDMQTWLGERGMHIRFHERAIEIVFSKFVPIEVITEAWNRIAEEMPVIGKPVVLPPDAERFRRGH